GLNSRQPRPGIVVARARQAVVCRPSMSYRTRFVRLTLAYLRSQGRDPSGLIEACALPRDVESAESIEFDLPKLTEFGDRASEFAGDPDLGIHLAEFSQRGDYGVAEYVA